MSVEKIKELGKVHSKENLEVLIKLYEEDISIEEKREVNW